ncbi:hypothetical protein H6G96_14135 [Nostoc sp. FACHB-892]|uniref:hypothetical protein n=1 Tax=Nostoc sp. FACHB-892 TaxID=2692843 RepID=UPI0016827095|nr:hypothetical protein [Nostoc sp. FACHB-892]MBD2727436.1 hypothetical protein [Nostoc sp. FACHB-892]
MKERSPFNIQKERSLGKLEMQCLRRATPTQFWTRCFKFRTRMTEQKGRTSEFQTLMTKQKG